MGAVLEALGSTELRPKAVRVHQTEATPGEGTAHGIFRAAFLAQVDSLTRATGASYPKTVDTAIHNLFLTDEPDHLSTLPFRRAKEIVEENYVFPNGDTLTSNNGSMIPHLQWLGLADWATNGSYFVRYFIPLGQKLQLYQADSSLFHDVPSAKHHNGGRYGVPEFFDLTELSDPSYVATMPGRIDTMERVLQLGRFGAALPEKIDEESWLVRGLYEAGEWGRRTGRRHFAGIGPASGYRLRLDSTLVIDPNGNYYAFFADTNVERRPEASEVRALVNMALAYGAQGLNYYLFDSQPWGMLKNDSVVHTGGTMIREIGFGGMTLQDTALFRLDFYIRDPNWTKLHPIYDSNGIHIGAYTDTLGMIPDLYVGWQSLTRELREINARVRELSPWLTRLNWRDGYSMHLQAKSPYTSYDDTLTVRPLPSDEIITAVTARHPITGEVDSAYETYVEIGLFDTRIGYNEVEVNDPILDTNTLAIVNRRVFETDNYAPEDVSYSAAIDSVLDSLTETRTITLDFNLGHPDTTQYAFIRVREVEPDLAELPLIGIREPLDTIIHGDSAVELTLGPGRAALLEITYEPGDESIVDGELWWSNQRKMVYYEDDRFHCTYLRNDTVFYRRSNAMGDTAASILWEAVETVVSTDQFTTRFENWGPSITMRSYLGDTIATIVWTSHTLDSFGVRDVLIRDLNLTQGTQSNIHFIDYHTGTDSTQWGDAVVNAAHGGDIIAWGDSTLGILARVRLLAPFGTPPALSARDSVSLPWHTTKVGRWPTVPTFAHIRGADSNVGIAWNQPMASGWNSEIIYARIVQLPATGGIPGIAVLNHQVMSAAPSLLGRPSMDQTQDVWERVQEGLVWQEENGGWAASEERIWFRSLYTPTRNGSAGDSVEPTQGWAFATVMGPKDPNPDCYPNTSALNEVYHPIDDSLKDAHFAVTFVDYDVFSPGLEQAIVQYSAPSFTTAYPYVYAFDGDMPHGSSSPITQDYRHGVLYETDIPGVGPVLRTTRQYFGARAKPTGYVAEGRSVHFPIDDSAGTYIEVLMHDAWIADDASGTPLEMIGRDFTEQTDTLAEAEGLLRTAYFAAGDSTRIGIELAGRFRGDSSLGGAAQVSLVAELVDSASGTVVQQLDSIPVSATADSQHVFHSEDYDLLSGTYYIRVRLDTAGLSIEDRPHGSRYPVAEYASRVDDSPAERAAVRLGPTTGDAVRISAQPNPFSDRTEIRFSIHDNERVTIVIVDASGREVARPVRDERFEAGRYAVEFETGNLVEGTYVMELRAGSQRAVEKLIVRR